jgi:hypothetical protein
MSVPTQQSVGDGRFAEYSIIAYFYWTITDSNHPIYRFGKKASVVLTSARYRRRKNHANLDNRGHLPCGKYRTYAKGPRIVQ